MVGINSIETNSVLPGLRSARFALGAIFFINGSALSTWASRIPAIQEKLGLATGPLGIALLSMAAGALLSMSFAGALSSRYGSRPVIAWGTVFSCFALVPPAFAPNLLLLGLGVACLGAALGSTDVAMNAHAISVERAYGKSIMSAFHALFSIGGVCGAALGTLMANLNIVPEIHFCISGAILLIIGLIARPRLLPASTDATGSTIDASLHLETLRFLFSSKFMFAASMIMFCCFMVEGAMGDWSGVFLRQVLKTDPGFAVLGYACFSVTMCIGRLTGDALIHRFGAHPVICTGSLLALLGLSLVVIPSNPICALVGFACIGLGASNIVPIAFSCGGNAPNMEPGKAIATVSLLGYFGLVAGPPIIGFTAELISLRGALGLLGTLLIAILFASAELNKSIPQKN